jgi:hypothetical protein
MHSLGTSALSLAERGLFVFPCLPRDKRPATKHGCKDATRDLAVIQQWWDENPDYNVAIATGRRVFVVDVDDAEAALRELELANTELPSTVESLTPRGRHIYFRTPQFEVRNSSGRVAPGIDVRGVGGYVIAPPSVHPSGRQYHWSVDSAKRAAEAPDWLLAKLDDRGNASPTAITEWRDLVANGADEGTRDCTIARLAGHLLRRRIDPVVVLELLKSWNATHCRPPLPVVDIERVCGSIAARELKRRQHDAG